MAVDYSTEIKFANEAMRFMGVHSVAPIPEHFTLWYHYAQGTHAELKAELDKCISQKIALTPNICHSIYQRLFVADKNQKVIDDTAGNAQKLLAQVLKAVNDFGDETKNYNKDVDSYIDNLSHDFGGDDVQEVVKQLLQATTTLKASGDRMNQRLEESKLEINNLRKSLEEVRIEAQRDSLTNVFNRKTFEKLLEEHMVAAQQHKFDICLLMLDVDHFKKFNDTYGHLIGDEVLKIVARALTDSVKGRDVVARYGGEEFLVFLPNTPLEGAVKVADAIRESIASKELKRKDTGEHFGRVTVSIGVARYRHGVDDVAKLIKRADDALYDSKRTGRNKVTREA